MPVLVKPTLDCNFRCTYCYEQVHRQISPSLVKLSREEFQNIKDTIKKVVDQGRKDITFHGGEFLLLPKGQIRDLLAYSYDLVGRSALQTNGYLIDDEIIDLFAKYKCSVGLSIDGPWPINRFRGFGSDEERKAQTERIIKAMKDMRAANVSVGVISVINKAHTEPGAMDLFKEWVLELKELGITGRMNLVQVTVPELKEVCEPTPEEAGKWYCEMADFILSDPKLLWQPFRDVVDNLLGLGTGTCTFGKCDIWCTPSAYVIHRDGTLGSCCRSLSEGIVFLRAPQQSLERTDLLAQTPYEYGGCKDCRYWKICYGHCPDGAINNDWRNRSRHCLAYKTLYEHIEKKLRGLMPTITLCIDDKTDDYDIRQRYEIGDKPFENMLSRYTQNPSTWRHGCRKPDADRPKSPEGCKTSSNDIKAQADEKWKVYDPETGQLLHIDHSDNIPPSLRKSSCQESKPEEGKWERVEGSKDHVDTPHIDNLVHLDHMDSNKGGVK